MSKGQARIQYYFNTFEAPHFAPAEDFSGQGNGTFSKGQRHVLHGSVSVSWEKSEPVLLRLSFGRNEADSLM